MRAGRGVLLSQALDTRTDLTRLAERHPDLAAEFVRLRDPLDTGVDLRGSSAPVAPQHRNAGVVAATTDRETERRRVLADEFDGLLEKIRREPGFEGFLLPLPVGELLVAATSGPVVLVNVSEIRSDALPLHAAGHHAPATVVDRVVSSYTPAVRSFIHARRPGPARPALRDRLLVVSLSRGPSTLPGAAAEAGKLGTLFAGRIETLAEERATFDTVAGTLPTCRWAHFACHAATDLTNPSASHLVLADHGTRPLTVLDLARLRPDDTELAYLSACATARTGPRLADEAIHLAGALQLAGYRHVIATLWPIVDRPAVRITTSVYEDVGDRGSAAAAEALHRATRRQRDPLPDRPFSWAAHLHYGG